MPGSETCPTDSQNPENRKVGTITQTREMEINHDNKNVEVCYVDEADSQSQLISLDLKEGTAKFSKEETVSINSSRSHQETSHQKPLHESQAQRQDQQLLNHQQLPQRQHHHQPQQPQQHQPHVYQPPHLSYAGRQVPVTLPAIPAACYVHQVAGLQPTTVDFIPVHQSFPLTNHRVINQMPLHFPAIVPSQHHHHQHQPPSAPPLTLGDHRITYDPHSLLCNQNLMQQIEWQMQVQKQHQQQLQQQVQQHHIPYQGNLCHQCPYNNQPTMNQHQLHPHHLHFLQTQHATPKADRQFVPREQQQQQASTADVHNKPCPKPPTPVQIPRTSKPPGGDNQAPTSTANNTQGVNLYVKHLDDDVDDTTLRKMFSRFGEVISAKVMMEGQKSRGFGFVCFARADDAARATRELRRKSDDLSKKNLYVAPAQRKEERQAFFREKLRSHMDDTTQESDVNLKQATKERNAFDLRNGKIPDIQQCHTMTPAGENVSEVPKVTEVAESTKIENTNDQSKTAAAFKAGTSVTITPKRSAKKQKNIFNLENFTPEKLAAPLMQMATFPQNIFLENGCQGHQSQSEPIPDSFFEAEDKSFVPSKQTESDTRYDSKSRLLNPTVGDRYTFPFWPEVDNHDKREEFTEKKEMCPNIKNNQKSDGNRKPAANADLCKERPENPNSDTQSANACGSGSRNVWNYTLIAKEGHDMSNDVLENTENNPDHFDCYDLVTDCIACCTDTDSASSVEEENVKRYHQGDQRSGKVNFQNGENNSNIDNCLKHKEIGKPETMTPEYTDTLKPGTKCEVTTQSDKGAFISVKRKGMEEHDKARPRKRKRSFAFDYEEEEEDVGRRPPKQANRGDKMVKFSYLLMN